MTETVDLTAQVVGAFVANNTVAASEMPELLRSVHKALAELANGHVEPVEPAKLEPAVPIKRSITNDGLTCLVCGSQHKMIKKHLKGAHDMTPESYRKAFDLNPDYPMVSPGYSQVRRELALASGLGRKAA